MLNGACSDPSKIVHFWRIQHECDNIVERPNNIDVNRSFGRMHAEKIMHALALCITNMLFGF